MNFDDSENNLEGGHTKIFNISKKYIWIRMTLMAHVRVIISTQKTTSFLEKLVFFPQSFTCTKNIHSSRHKFVTWR